MTASVSPCSSLPAVAEPLRQTDAPLPAGATDQQLIAAAVTGNPTAFNRLVKRYERQVARTATGMLGRGADAEDVGQETMLRLYQNLGRFRGEAALGTYLTRIAIHLCLRQLQRRRGWLSFFEPQTLAGLDHAPRAESAAQTAQRTQSAGLANRALSRLAPQDRAVVVLRILQEYSTKETARILGLREGTVMSRLARALAKLAAVLDPESL